MSVRKTKLTACETAAEMTAKSSQKVSKKIECVFRNPFELTENKVEIRRALWENRKRHTQVVKSVLP